MAVAFDAKMTGGNGTGGLDQTVSGATSISSTGMTVGASASLLLGLAVWQDNLSTDITSRSMTWDSVSMSEEVTILQTTGTNNLRVSIFKLLAPNAGNKTLAGAWTNTADCYVSAISYTGTDIVTGIYVAHSVTASGTTQITVTSDASGATVAVFGVNGNAPTTNFNTIFSDAPFNPGGGGSYQIAGTSNIHTFTGGGGTIQALAGVHVIPLGGLKFDHGTIYSNFKTSHRPRPFGPGFGR
jgi:hypothetical protein